MSNDLQIESGTYPNGDPFKKVVFRGELIGSYTERDGGYYPYGKRAPRKTVFDAVLNIVADRQREAQKQVDFFQQVRDAAFTQQHELK